MAVWENPEVMGDLGAVDLEFARVWQAADKIIYSRSLDSVSTTKTRLERDFDPEDIRKLKTDSTHDICVGGANLAAQAIRAGLVDEIHLFVVPATIGGGISVLPRDYPLKLELLEQRPIGDGWTYLCYQTQTAFDK